MRASEFLVEYKKYPTQDYEGIKISMVEKDGRLFVRAIDDWGVNELGSVEFVIGDSKELDPQDLQVDDRYQGQGIARTMYDYVKSKGYKIQRSWDQTDAGAGFWNKHRGEDVRVWEDKQQDITAYHGNQGGIHKELITPMWWTEDRDTAVYYATQYGGDGYVYTATLSCQNPYVITDKDETNTMVEKYKALAQQGYDSIYDPRGHDWIPFYNKDIHITDKEYLDGEEQGVAEASDHMLSEEQPEVRPHRVTDKELVELLGKGKTNAMLRHPWFQRYSSYEKAYRYARDRWGFVTVDMFPYMTSVNKTADGSIRPTIYVSFIFSYTGPKVVQAHQFRRDQDPDEFEKRNPVTGGWKHGSTWKADKTDEVTEGRGSGYKEIEFVCANPEFPDATDHALQKQLYAGLQKIPGVIPLFQDQSDYSEGQYSLTAIYKDPPVRGQILKLAKQLGVSVDLERPVTDDYVDRAIRGEHEGQQGVTEDDNQSTPIQINSNARALAWIEKVYAAYPQTWQNNHVMPLGGSGDDQQFAMFELVPSMSQRGAVEIKWFQAYPLRQGVGTRAMQELQRLAQADGISLTLFPWDKGQVSQSKLMKFYKSAGFQPTVKGSKSLAWSPESMTEDAIQEDAVMGKIEQSGKIVRILKKQHTVPFSDEKDWLLIDTDPARGNRGLGLKWIPAHTRFEWVRPYRDTIDENFADGRGPGRPGDSQRHGIPKGATMAQLEKAAKAPGRKGQLARWQLNMRRGKAKAK